MLTFTKTVPSSYACLTSPSPHHFPPPCFHLPQPKQLQPSWTLETRRNRKRKANAAAAPSALCGFGYPPTASTSLRDGNSKARDSAHPDSKAPSHAPPNAKTERSRPTPNDPVESSCLPSQAPNTTSPPHQPLLQATPPDEGTKPPSSRPTTSSTASLRAEPRTRAAKRSSLRIVPAKLQAGGALTVWQLQKAIHLLHYKQLRVPIADEQHSNDLESS